MKAPLQEASVTELEWARAYVEKKKKDANLPAVALAAWEFRVFRKQQ